MIKILNRGYISVAPKTLFWAEAQKVTDNQIINTKNPEATIYLVEEDFWDDEVILKKHFKQIVLSEKRQVDTSGLMNLEAITFENIHDYFEIHLGNLVIDNEDKPLQVTKDDLSN
ncbi:MAG: hypothetical protein QNK70_03495 [Crocinitomicaceae bacterium]|tara:strand:+ start:71 stop:415 length:345 start_codon:yes stop_codon:yes gene_type:complete